MHECVCGHTPDWHYAETGKCEWLNFDEKWCDCPRYEWQGDQ